MGRRKRENAITGEIYCKEGVNSQQRDSGAEEMKHRLIQIYRSGAPAQPPLTTTRSE